jgi:hypothetical protein
MGNGKKGFGKLHKRYTKKPTGNKGLIFAIM